MYTVLNVVRSPSIAATPRTDLPQTVQLAGIQFDLIVVRVGRGIAVEHLEAQTSRREMQINLRAMGRPIPVNPSGTIEVSITQEMETSADRTYPRAHFDIEDVKPDLTCNSKSVGIDGSYE